MGYALAWASRQRGADVLLISGPTALTPPPGIEVLQVTTAAEMHSAVMARAEAMDVVIMAAAVEDYAPDAAARQKIHKDEQSITLTLTRTPDILGELGRRRAGRERPLLVGFAAETNEIVRQAQKKLREKAVDLIVANDVSRTDAGFEVDTNEVTLVSAGAEETVPLQSKTAVAQRVLDRIETMLRSRTPALK